MKKNEKTALTPNEVLRVAYADIVNGIDQHHLASLLAVNSGRITEAAIAIRWAMDHHMLIYRHVLKQKKNGKLKSKLVAEFMQQPKLLTDDANED